MRHTRPNRAVMALASLALVTSACAGARVESSQRFDTDRHLPKPPMMVLHDFAVSEHDVVVDAFGPSFVTGPGDESERSAKGHAVAAAFAERVVAKLNERGIVAARAKDTPVPPMHASVIKGQFLSVSEGDKMSRVVIGFGAGTSEIRVRVQAYQVTADGLRRMSEAVGMSHGSKKPGMAVPIIGGAIWGSVMISAAVSGAMTVVSESLGGMDADVERLADLLAERAQAFYQEQGWL